MARFSKPIPITAEDAPALASFECGESDIDQWLRRRALANDIRGGSRTYLVLSLDDGELAGFFALSTHSVEHCSLRASLRRNMPAPLPVILLGQLAVSKKFQGQGLGDSLLMAALDISMAAAESIGVAALVVHPISEKARLFYIKRGFSTAKTNSPMLFYGLHEKS